MADAVLKAESVKCYFKQASGKLEVLKDVSLTLERGEMVGLIAPSGAGKSTLLHILGLLDAASAGKLEVMGKQVSGTNESLCTSLRLKHIGFVYQFHHLLPEFTALENVMMPLLVAGESRAQAKNTASDMLSLLGLGKRLGHRPAKLSGGEQQRVAIARALITEPDLLLADEPTGNLDPSTADQVFDMLMHSLTALDENKRPAMLLATHNMEMAGRMSRVVKLENGSLIS